VGAVGSLPQFQFYDIFKRPIHSGVIVTRIDTPREVIVAIYEH